MAWRKWLVRGLVVMVAGGLAGGVLLYQQWTNPAAVRRQVVEHLRTLLTGANVSLGSAHMRLLGGISLSELRLSRRDDPDRTDLAYIPAATIYPDKEQVLNGKLVIRKVELYRPHLHLRRSRDGQWNFIGLLAPPQPDAPIPTLDIKQGTLVLEDQLGCPGLPPVEITDVNLTLINDPLPVVQFQGKGLSELIDTLQVRGTFQRLTGDVAASLRVGGIKVGKPLLQRLGAYCPRLTEHVEKYGLELEGTARFQAEIGYSPRASRSWTHQLNAQLTGGKFRHAEVPLSLENLDADLDCLDGRMTLNHLTARSGTTEVQLEGSARDYHEDADCNGTLVVKHLPVTPALFEHLPDNLKKVEKDYAPAGPVTVTFFGERKASQWRKRCTIQPEDLSATYVKFPYTLEHITGTIVQENDTEKGLDRTYIDLTGLSGTQRVFIKGDILGEASHSAVEVKIWGDNIPLDQKLMDALSPAHQRVAASFHPTGLANFEAYIHRHQGATEFANRYLIRFHHTAVKYDVFRYPLEDVTGTLDIQPQQWEFHDFHGSHKGGTVVASGRFRPAADTPDKGRLTVQIHGQNFVLDQELEEALEDKERPELKQAWNSFHPTGQMHFIAQVVRLGEQPPEVEVDVNAFGCTIQPDFFAYALEDLSGHLHYANRWIHLDHFKARHGTTGMTLDKGRLFVKPEGGVWGEIITIQARQLAPDADLLSALPPVLRHAVETVKLKDPVDLKTTLTLATTPNSPQSPDIYWDGEVNFHDATLTTGVALEHVTGTAACQGRYQGQQLEGLVGHLVLDQTTLFNQPFSDIHADLEIAKEVPNTLVIRGLYARLFGGAVYGPIRVEFGPRIRYEMWLTASQIKLEEFGRRNLGKDSQISGLATAELHLEGRGPEPSDLTGRGSIDVPNGRLYNNLPLLLDLLKFLAIRLPDGTAFEEAHASFTIRGQRMAISRLDLYGNAISLRGQGEMNLDGTDINLDFYAAWARVTLLLPPILRELPQDVSKYLFKIQMRGKLGDVHFTKEPLPPLVEPFKGLLERMMSRRATGKDAPDKKNDSSAPPGRPFPVSLFKGAPQQMPEN
jgi:hypothetical protein